ncbi:glycosyltransferase [Gammaproteobacteria bacterium]|nr:glycosyltransferase [Gammaproteobacteria bacterium]
MHISFSSHQPLVSLFIPSYNHAEYLHETIQSMIAQTYPNIELLIIDDGSQDRSVEIINTFEQECHHRFQRYEFIHCKNKGLSLSLNQAIKWSKGKYFAACASDDIYLPGKIAFQVPLLEDDNSLIGAFGGCDVIDSNSNITQEILPDEESFSFKSILIREHLLIAPTALLRSQALKEAGEYPSDLYIEDWYMWLQLSKKFGKLKVFRKKLVQYRRHENNMSQNIEKMHQSRMQIIDQFQDSIFYGLAKSKIFVAASIEYSFSNKKQSYILIKDAIVSSYSIVRYPIFYKALIRLAIPIPIWRILTRLKEII